MRAILRPSARRAEVTAILRGRHAHAAPERAMHRLGTAEAARVGHLGHRASGRLRQTARRLHGLPLDPGRGRGADFATEDAREVARAHAGAARELRGAQVGVEMVRDPRLHVPHAVALRKLSRELYAELRLPTRA